MKYLGIDYGTKRIGIALSNQEGTLAFPKNIISNSQDSTQDILDIIEHEQVDTVVIGKSLDSQGFDNAVQKHINIFIKKLGYHFDGEIVEQDERGSSIAAASHLYGKGNIANEKWSGKKNAQKRGHNDAHAATIILQRYLDKQKLAS